MPVAIEELALMSLYQNANQGRHGTLAIFFRENMPGFYFTIWSVFIGHWTPPWNCFLSYNPRELCFACQLKHFTDLNFLGHYNSFFFFSKTAIENWIIILFFQMLSVLRKACSLYDVGLFGSLDKMDSSSKWMNEIKSTSLPLSYLGEEALRTMWPITVFLQAT